MSVAPPIRAYEHLGGASGRQMRYRAPRHEAKALFSGPFPVAVLRGEPYILCDLSLSGIAVIGSAQGADGLPLEVGGEVLLALKLGDASLHEGRAFVVRREETALGTKLGLAFIGRMLDLEDVAARYRHEILRLRLKASLDPHQGQPPEGFRLLCADLVDRLRACRRVLEAEDAAASVEGQRNDGDALVAICREALRPFWRDATLKANALLDAVLEDPPALAVMKGFAERVLTAELTAGPLWRRAFEKPLGHPGDYALSAALHTAPRRSPTLYATFLDALARDAFAWMPDRTLALAQAVAREIAQHKSASPFKLASIGCGGADELQALCERGRLSRPVAVTLVEQDEGALGYAYRNLARLSMKEPSRLSLRALHASHAKLIDGGELVGALGEHHLILAPTLLDYLRHRPATQLLDALFRLLVPGGLLLAACLRAHAGSSRWVTELLCDWSMIHRSRGEAFALAASLPRAKTDLRHASEGDVYILAIRRPRMER